MGFSLKRLFRGKRARGQAGSDDRVGRHGVNSRRELERLRARAEESGLVKLHFGCGPRILKGWINIDLAYEGYEAYLKYYTDKYYPPEARGSRDEFFALDLTTTALPLRDNSVDVVFHEDFMEHLSQKGQILLLAETHRVLKPGGVHRVNTPNLVASMQRHSRFDEGYPGVHVKEWDAHGHVSVLTPAYLQEIASLTGYSEVMFNGRNQSASDLIPPEYRPDPNDRDEAGNIFADLKK